MGSKSFLIFVLSVLTTLSAFAQTEADKPNFAKRTIKLGSTSIVVEIADTPEKQMFGLMYRKHLKENEGMLFIFDNEEPRSFWMKNTLIPLAIGYFDRNQTLINVQEMKPEVLGAMRPKTYPSARPAKFALEMNQGWFQKMKIWPGVKFSFADNKGRK